MKNMRILLAEDDCVVAADLAFELEAQGLTLSAITRSVAGVLKSIETANVSLGVLNVSLSDGAIYPAAKRFKSLGIPFLFLTSFERNDIDPEYSDIPYLAKPQESESIARCIADFARSLCGPNPKPMPCEGAGT